jgi:hypothetical protein
MWGPHTIVSTASECCAKCQAHRAAEEAKGSPGCTVWVFCPEEGGCNGQKQGECWGKHTGGGSGGDLAATRPTVRAKGSGVPWISGAAFTAAEAAAVARAEAEAARAVVQRRERPGNPRVYLDVRITSRDGGSGGEGAAGGGRMEFVLYARESPRAAENFRAMCTGERPRYSFKGMKFYRIIDMVGWRPAAAAGGRLSARSMCRLLCRPSSRASDDPRDLPSRRRRVLCPLRQSLRTRSCSLRTRPRLRPLLLSLRHFLCPRPLPHAKYI